MKQVLLILIILFISVMIPSASYGEIKWTRVTDLPYPMASQASYILDKDMYVFGGASSTVYQNLLKTSINSFGDIDMWTTIGENAGPFYFHSLVGRNQKIYSIGGATFPSFLPSSNVYLGLIEQGTLKGWKNQSSLPNSLALGQAIIKGDKIYYAGGFDLINSDRSEIYYADLLEDGTLTKWHLAGYLPKGLSGFGLINYKKFLIAIGGKSNGVFQSKVYRTEINNDGTIGTWLETTSLPEAIYRSSVLIENNIIYSIGGYNNVSLDKVYFTSINDDGSIEQWNLSENRLPEPICCGSANSLYNYIYLIGGANSSDPAIYKKTVYKGELDKLKLNVPYFSQNSSPWGSQEYDSTLSKLGVPGQTMDMWGCAITSLAMILRYHGMNEFSDGTSIDPGSLNTWMKNNNGYLSWWDNNEWFSYWNPPAIQKLTRDLYKAGKSKTKLIHKVGFADNQNLILNRDVVDGKFPDMIFVKNKDTTSHFVVATGKGDGTFYINDPEWNYPNLTFFDNNYYKIDRFIPSNTDFSYIVNATNPSVEILITDEQGRKSGKFVKNGIIEKFNEIPNGTNSYVPPISNEGKNLGSGVNEFLLPQSLSGKYIITISGENSKKYTLNIVLYQEDGDDQLIQQKGQVGLGSVDQYELDYSKIAPSSIERVVVFETILNDIDESAQNKQFKNSGIINSLKAKVRAAEHNINPDKSMKILDSLLNELNAQKGKGVSEEAYQILIYDVYYLKSHL